MKAKNISVIRFLLTINALLINSIAHAVCYQDPLIIDLGQDGLHLGPAGHTVNFDMAGTGIAIEMQWVKPNGNEAFLVMDKNGNGIVDDGTEMFTNYGYLILEDRTADNGFVELAQYDNLNLGGNDDAYIDANDEIWSRLSLWLDINADGISTPNEMLSLEDAELTRLGAIAKENSGRRDEAGNVIPLWAWVFNDNATGNKKHKMYDVFFKEAPQTIENPQFNSGNSSF